MIQSPLKANQKSNWSSAEDPSYSHTVIDTLGICLVLNNNFVVIFNWWSIYHELIGYILPILHPIDGQRIFLQDRSQGPSSCSASCWSWDQHHLDGFPSRNHLFKRFKRIKIFKRIERFKRFKRLFKRFKRFKLHHHHHHVMTWSIPFLNSLRGKVWLMMSSMGSSPAAIMEIAWRYHKIDEYH